MNLKPPDGLLPEKHVRKVLTAVIGFVAVTILGGCWLLNSGGKSDADVVKINDVPMSAIQGDCDPDGCQLWWLYDDTSGTWLLHAGTRAAAVQAIADGAVYVKVPTVG